MTARKPGSRRGPQAIGCAAGLPGLCAAVIHRAVEDMRKGNISALVWLSTTAAEPYWHFINCDQEWALRKCGWPTEAERALACPNLSIGERQLITEGLDYFDRLTGL